MTTLRGAGMSFLRHPNAGPVGYARGNSDDHGFGAHFLAGTAAAGTGRVRHPAGAAAGLTRFGEHHAAAARADHAASLAMLAPRFGDREGPRSVAGATSDASCEGQRPLRALKGFVECH